MKTKTQTEKPANEKQSKPNSNKRSAQVKKVPTRMGYHGKDEEKNLNPEE